MQHDPRRLGEALVGTAESKNLSMPENFSRENREILLVSDQERRRVVLDGNGQTTPMEVPLTCTPKGSQMSP